MTRFVKAAVAAAMLFSASQAFAGGPVVVEDSLEVVADQPASSVGILPVILIAVALCAALCGNDEPKKMGCTAVIDC